MHLNAFEVHLQKVNKFPGITEIFSGTNFRSPISFELPNDGFLIYEFLLILHFFDQTNYFVSYSLFMALTFEIVFSAFILYIEQPKWLCNMHSNTQISSDLSTDYSLRIVLVYCEMCGIK